LLETKTGSKWNESEKKIIELIEVSVLKLKRTIVDLTEITKVQKELNAEAEPILLEEVLKDVQTDVSQLIEEARCPYPHPFRSTHYPFCPQKHQKYTL
jgi:signal transduction histidine kinase